MLSNLCKRELLRNWLASQGIESGDMSYPAMWAQYAKVADPGKYAKSEVERETHAGILLAKGQFPARHRDSLGSIDLGNVEWTKMRDTLCDRLESPDGFLMVLLGNRGTRKTQMATSVGHHAAKFDMTVAYRTAADLFRDVRKTFTVKTESESDIIGYLAGVDYLVIDEAHQRGGSEWENNQLTSLIDARYREKRCTLMIANQSTAQFSKEIGDSVVDRINETGAIWECKWPGCRTPKVWGQTRKQV